MPANLKILFENEEILVVDKPAEIPVYTEGTRSVCTEETRNIYTKKNQGIRSENKGTTLMNMVLAERPELGEIGSSPRYGLIHRLDRDTSGITAIAKTEGALTEFQRLFKERAVLKKYIALVCGNIKEDSGRIETLIGRSPKDRLMQKAYPISEEKTGLRESITLFNALKRFEGYTLVEAEPKTGRKHQLRVHFSHIGRPIAGDEVYGFKDSKTPKDLERHFLHASKLEIKSKNIKIESELPEDLKKVLKQIPQRI